MITLRNSDLTKFIECRRKFYLEHVLGLVPKPSSVPLLEDGPLPAKKSTKAHIGTMVHEVLNQWYNSTIEEADLVTVREICASKAIALGGAELFEEVPLLVGDWPGHVDYATKMALGYIEWVSQNDIDLGLTTLFTERTFEASLGTIHGEEVKVTGTVDIGVFDELSKSYAVGDHKTVTTMTQIPRPGNFQLMTYSWLWYVSQDVLPEYAFHNQILRSKRTARAKPPFYDRVPINISPGMVEMHGRRIDSLAHDIIKFYHEVSGDNDRHLLTAYPNMTGECDWKCDVKDLCDQMDGASDWRHVSDTYYINSNNRETA